MFNPVNPSILSFNPSTPSISSLPAQESQLFSKRKKETKKEETFHPFVSSSSNSLPNGHYHTNLHHYPSNVFTQFLLINQNFFSSKLYIFWGYTFLLHTAKWALKFWHNFRPGSRCDSELAHRRWKENDQEIYKESSKKNSTIDERLRRLHRESIFDVTAFHFLLLTHQNIIYIPVIS